MQSLNRSSCFCVLKSVQCLQSPSVRWLRRVKPYWIGIAKTKMFKFPPLVQAPKEEDDEFRRLKNYTYTYNRSFREFMKERHEIYQAKQMSDARETTEEAEFSRIFNDIEKDNAVVSANREQALVKEWSETKAQILEMKHKYEEEERIRLEETETKIMSEMERLQSAITTEKLDEAIEKALSGEMDYNFAIDKKGNLFHGRVTHINIK